MSGDASHRAANRDRSYATSADVAATVSGAAGRGERPPSDSTRVLAVDLGATSVRVAAVDLAAPAPEVEVLHRWHHAPRRLDGHLRWDWQGIVSHVVQGLEIGLAAGPVASIGVDGWGVDYGLLDGGGELLAPPVSYRDSRTEGWEEVAARIGERRLYESTGIQLMGINTVFQLAVERRELLDRARRLLLLPDLLVHQLCGFAGAEVSNLSTTSLMDARTRTWSDDLLAEVGVPRDLLPEPVTAGASAGRWRGVPVTVVGSHDTASAFLGAPGGRPGDVFVSAGSWVLVGVERPEPDTSAEARELNFSNEAGALGGVRFLKNVVGFWVLERCLSAWQDQAMAEVLADAEAVGGPLPRLDVLDKGLLGAADMVEAVLESTGLPRDTPPAVVTRCVLESIVEGTATVIEELEGLHGVPLERVVVVGGGARMALFLELLRERTGRQVVVGSPEATALGNAVVQGLALGRFADRAEASAWLQEEPVKE